MVRGGEREQQLRDLIDVDLPADELERLARVDTLLREGFGRRRRLHSVEDRTTLTTGGHTMKRLLIAVAAVAALVVAVVLLTALGGGGGGGPGY
ncbi:MAG TPA: hypothetical protein VH305_00695 [Gaiella sp.]|jgi:hypothetical protein